MKLGSSKLKQRARLTTTAPNNEWFRNVVKSIGYTSADIIKETIPSTFEFATSNGKDAMELYQQLREDGPKSVSKMLSEGVEKNQYIKFANDAIRNMKEDLRTGKIYNKEREEQAALQDGNNDDDDFGFDIDEDFSFGDDDDDFDYTPEEDDSSSTKVTNVKKVTVNNINANITKNNPMVKSIQSQSEVMVGLTEATNKTNVALASTSYTLTSRIASDVMTGISTINDNLTALVNFNNDSMSKYVAASLQYYEDSLSVMKQSLELAIKPYSPEVKERPDESDIFLSSGGLNIKEYINKVKRNTKTTIENDLILNSIYSMASDTDTLRMLAANPLQAIPKAISKALIPNMIRESAKQFDETFAAFFPALLQRFNRMSDRNDNWLLKIAGQIFGYNPKINTTVEVDKYNKGDMHFNGITQKAITEVIPTYLRKILVAINGGNEMIFDYQKGKFTDYMEAHESRKQEDRQAIYSGMEMYSELKSRLNAIEFTDEKYKKDMLSEFDNFMYRLGRSAGGVNPNIRKNKQGEIIDEFKDFYSGEFSEIFRSAILSLTPAQQMRLMGSDLFEAKRNYGRRIDTIQTNIGESLIPVLEAWDSTNEYKKNEKTGKYERDPKLTSFGGGHLDKYEKTQLDYLREIRNVLVEGLIVYPKGTTYRDRNRIVRTDAAANELFEKRSKRLSDIIYENDKQEDKEQKEKTRTIKEYTEKELERKKAKGIRVASSTSDLVADMSNDQMVDMFKNFVQIRDADEEAERQQQRAGGWITKMLTKGAKKIGSVSDVFENIISLPGRVVSNVLHELDGGLYKLVFGVNEDGSDRSFLSRVTTSIKTSFSSFFEWTKTKFFEPINNALFGENGFFTRIKNSQMMEKFRKFGDKMAEWAFGNIDDTGHRRNGAFSEAFNEIKDIGSEVKNSLTGKEYTDRNGQVHEATDNSVFGSVNKVTGSVLSNTKTYLFGNKQSQSTPDSTSATTVATTNENNNQDGHGGENFVSKVMGWLKDNLSMRYRVESDGVTSEDNTVRFGENVDSAKGGFAPVMLNGFPYFSQRDPRYADIPYNLSTGKGSGDSLSFGDRGCGPTALAMVASGMGKNIDPIQMGEIATETGYSVEGGTRGAFFSSIGNKLGLNVKEKQTDESKVNSAIRDGKPIIFRGRKTTDRLTPFTSEGHFVVGVGGKDGKVSINDPNSPMSSGEYDIKDIVSESNKMWTFDDTGMGKSRSKRRAQQRKNKKQSKVNKSSNNIVTAANNQVANNDPYYGVGDWIKDAIKDDAGEVRGIFGEFIDGINEAGHEFVELAFGTNEERDTKTKKFLTTFRERLPKGIAGGIIGAGVGAVVSATGGMGLLGSLFLPGGPVGGAVLGTAIGFATQSEKFKDWLFGKQDPADTSKRLGGFINQKTQKFIKDHKSTIIGGATIGGIKGALTGAGILPGLLFGGPLTGALMGVGVGLAVRSQKFQEMVFGRDDAETGKKVGGMLSKSYNAFSNNKKKIGGAAIGLLGGAAAGLVTSNMGLLGSSFFLGPVGMAIAGAGLGIAAASDKWKEKVFGKLNEETNQREGGLLQDFKATLQDYVLTPLKDIAKETTADMKFWFQEKVLLPVADLFGPLKSAVRMMAEDVMYKLYDIGDSIKFTFNKFIGEPLGDFIKEKIIGNIVELNRHLYNGVKGITKFIVGAPFKVLDETINKGAAKIVQKRARKRQSKYEDAMQQLYVLEDLKNRGLMTEKESRTYDRLRRVEKRYYSDAYDQDKLNAYDNFSEIRAKRVKEIQNERNNKMNELKKERELHKKQRRFNAIFGSTVEFDEEILNEYEKIFQRDNAKHIKGAKAKRLAKERALEFIKKYQEGKINKDNASKEVVFIRDEVKENLSPIRKGIDKIGDGISSIIRILSNSATYVHSKAAQTAGNVFAKTTLGQRRQERADKYIQDAFNLMRVDENTKNYLDRAKNQDNKTLRERFPEAFKTSRKSGDAKGGKDPSWLMSGKGDADKKTGFFSSMGKTMFSALKRFDKVNDKEEDIKAKKNEVRTKLAEKQKDVTSKNYANIRQELIKKKKENDEHDWRNKLLDAVEGIRERGGYFTNAWDKIFSKKGIITMGLMLLAPKILDFFKNPAKFLKEAVTNLLSNIKISIDWLFGKGNEHRQDADGSVISNTGLEDASARLARNGVYKGAKYLFTDGTKGNKILKASSKFVKKNYTSAKNFIKHIKPYNVAEDLVKNGVVGVDNLRAFGVNSAEDLATLGIKNVNQLKKIGISSADDLIALGFNTTDDLAKFGFKKAKSVGMEEALGYAEKKLVKKEPIKALGKKVASKASNATNAIVETGRKAMNSKFVGAIQEWVQKVFTSKSVIKRLGETAAAKSLKNISGKISKTFTESVLGKYALKISASIAEATGRAVGAVGTLGVATVAFGVADFISGAVNTERLFEIPAGTATWQMKMISSLLQTALGIGMIGPIIDVANEILAEVTGINILTMMATIIYECMVSDEKAIELGRLQEELDAEYKAYKEVNGLDDLSKRAYIDKVNPSLGSKILNKAKGVGNALTGNMFNTDKIRETLGKTNGERVSITDRISQLSGSIIGGVTFGNVNSEDATRYLANKFNNAKYKAGQMYNKAKEVMTWDNAKKVAGKAGHFLTGNMFNDDKIRQDLGLNENTKILIKDRVAMGVASTIEKVTFGALKSSNIADNVHGALVMAENGIKSITDGAKEFWNGFKTSVSEKWETTKNNFVEGAKDFDKKLGGMLGIQDENGNPLGLAEITKSGVDKFVKGLGGVVTDLGNRASEFWKDTSEKFSKAFNSIKEIFPKAINELNKGLGKLMGFEDENGNPISLTDAVKNGWSKTVTKANNLWNSFKQWLGNPTHEASQNNVQTRNQAANNNYGTGGFGGEELPRNIGARGCGPTAMAMVASRITGAQIDPVMMSNLATQGGFAGNYGTNGAYFGYAANQLGISARESKTSRQGLEQALSSGEPVILRGQSRGDRNSAFTRAGHYVVAVGTRDNKVIINDPRGEQYSGAYNMSDVVSQSNVMWSFGNSRGAYSRPGELVLGGASSNTVPGELLVQYALVHKGKPYVWGANGPDSFDCSGLVNYVCKLAGLNIPGSRPTAEVWRQNTTSISKNELRVGDLGFLVKGGKATHVGIYAGDGLWVHAEGGSGKNGAGGSVVLNDRKYWTHYGRIKNVAATQTAYRETSGVSSVAFNNGGSNKANSVLTNIIGYLGDVFNTGINSAISGQVGTFQSYNDYLLANSSNSNNSSSMSYTDTVGSVSLGSRKTTADLLNKTLGGRLAGKGAAIISIGNKYGVDPAFLASILHHESANGTSNAIINKNNPGGIMDASTNWSTLKSFATLEEGIEYTASNLKRNYLDKGLKTIPQIGSKYAPVGAANDPRGLNKNWVPNVTTLYNKYSSETGNGGFGEGFAPTTSNVYRFGDKLSSLDAIGDYIGSGAPLQSYDVDANTNNDRVVGVMETMVDVLKTIADNTGITNSRIGEAISTAVNRISNVSNSNVNVNNVTNQGNRTINTSSQYSAREIANRSIAEKIAAGKYA